jgi:hypothetical protein
MTSECKGGGMFVGRWSVTVRNTTSCPVCRLPQPVRPYGGRYKIVDHREPETASISDRRDGHVATLEIREQADES